MTFISVLIAGISLVFFVGIIFYWLYSLMDAYHCKNKIETGILSLDLDDYKKSELNVAEGCLFAVMRESQIDAKEMFRRPSAASQKSIGFMIFNDALVRYVGTTVFMLLLTILLLRLG